MLGDVKGQDGVNAMDLEVRGFASGTLGCDAFGEKDVGKDAKPLVRVGFGGVDGIPNISVSSFDGSVGLGVVGGNMNMSDVELFE